MRLESAFILGLDHAFGCRKRLHGRLGIVFLLAGEHGYGIGRGGLGGADVVVHSLLSAGEGALYVAPGHLERTRGANRVPLVLGDDGDEAALDERLRTTNARERGSV